MVAACCYGGRPADRLFASSLARSPVFVPPPDRPCRTVRPRPPLLGHTPGCTHAPAVRPWPTLLGHMSGCFRPSRPCRPSLAAAAWPFARSRRSIRPPLHLLAVLAIRTRTRPFGRACLAVRARPPVPPRSCSARHPHSHRPLSRVCDHQHVPAGPPLYLLAVPVTRTCTVLSAVSASPSTCPPAVLPPGRPPVRRSAVRRRIRWPARPLAVRLPACRPRRARPTDAYRPLSRVC